jgi:hypothetical protein
MIERITKDGRIMAIIIRNDHSADGISFVTPGEFSQQLAYMKHPKGKIIVHHLHNPISRQIEDTQEVLFVKQGTVRVDLFDAQKQHFGSRMLSAGDVILLSSGGHGFEVMEDAVLIEVKQGPYLGEHEKTRFAHGGPVEG